MNGRFGDSALSATTATCSISSGRPRSRSAKLTQSIEARSARPSATAVYARFMRAGHDDCAKERRTAGDRSDRCAEQIHAGVAVLGVERSGRAAKFTKRAARVVQTSNDEASVRGAFAAGKRIVRRRDQPHQIFEFGHIGIAACLTEDEAGMSPERGEVASSRQTCRRLNAGVVEPREDRGPQRVIGCRGPRKIVHRQDRNRRFAAHAARRSQPG